MHYEYFGIYSYSFTVFKQYPGYKRKKIKILEAGATSLEINFNFGFQIWRKEHIIQILHTFNCSIIYYKDLFIKFSEADSELCND